MKNICSLLFLFLGLCLSALAGAQADVTLLVTTDTSCDWKLDGRPMGLLKVGESNVVPVSPGSHVIEAATTDGVTTIRTKVEVDQGLRTVDIQLKSQNHQQSKMQHAETAREPARADAPLNPTWTDPSTGLMWSKKDNGSDVNWNQAIVYCSKLQLAGYNDWRLPNIEELQGIYDPSISVRTVFDNGVTFNVRVKGDLKLTGSQWSSSQGDAPGKPWQTAWSFNFGSEKQLRGTATLGFNFSSRALCVRRSGE